MALIDCGECKRMASDQAAACPHCGAPIAQANETAYVAHTIQPRRSVGFWLGTGVLLMPLVFVWFLLRQGHSTSSRAIGFAWLAVALLVMTGREASDTRSTAIPANHSQSEKVAAPAEAVKEYSAQQLAQAYERNTVAADQRYKGKRFKVTGVVDSINTDLFGNPYVTLRGGVNQFMEPQFELDSAHRNYAAGLQQGLRVTLVCRGRGDIAKTPMSDECVPVN